MLIPEECTVHKGDHCWHAFPAALGLRRCSPGHAVRTFFSGRMLCSTITPWAFFACIYRYVIYEQTLPAFDFHSGFRLGGLLARGTCFHVASATREESHSMNALEPPSPNVRLCSLMRMPSR